MRNSIIILLVALLMTGTPMATGELYGDTKDEIMTYINCKVAMSQCDADGISEAGIRETLQTLPPDVVCLVAPDEPWADCQYEEPEDPPEVGELVCQHVEFLVVIVASELDGDNVVYVCGYNIGGRAVPDPCEGYPEYNPLSDGEEFLFGLCGQEYFLPTLPGLPSEEEICDEWPTVNPLDDGITWIITLCGQPYYVPAAEGGAVHDVSADGGGTGYAWASYADRTYDVAAAMTAFGYHHDDCAGAAAVTINLVVAGRAPEYEDPYSMTLSGFVAPQPFDTQTLAGQTGYQIPVTFLASLADASDVANATLAIRASGLYEGILTIDFGTYVEATTAGTTFGVQVVGTHAEFPEYELSFGSGMVGAWKSLYSAC